jgi:C4-dicarboxylate transporter DctM subunit
MIQSEIVGVVGTILLFILILFGSPVWLALTLVGVCGSLVVLGFSPTIGILSSTPYFTVASFAFVVLPLFVLMGEFAVHAGISEQAYAFARKWMGGLHGGLAMATTLGCAIFGAVTGSSLATAALFTRIAVPEMKKYGYDNRISVAVVACSGTLAVLIPPSAVMIFFCILTGTSLGKLMIAGFIPGFLSAFIYMVMIYIWARLNPRLAPPLLLSVSWKEKCLASVAVLPVGAIIVVMLGGIYAGIFSPSEAGAIGAFCTFIAALVSKSLKLRQMTNSLLNTVKTTVMVLFIIMGGMIYGKFLLITGLTGKIIDLFMNLQAPPIVSVALILLAYIAGGCIMPVMAMLAITLPIVFPLLTEGFGYDPVWVGIISIKILEIAAITPPVGLNLYTVKAAGGESVDFKDLIRGIFPFFAMDVLTLTILVAFPVISLWLPEKMF